jgi:DNA-binding transcriptional ArsR family regulator
MARISPLGALGALGDPTRRTIFESLAKKPMPVGELASTLPISRPAVSQHLRVLREAGLVTETTEGTRHIYRIDPRGVGAIREWLDSHWGEALESFRTFVNSEGDRRK